MSAAVDAAVRTYLEILAERDPNARAALVEACWAAEGRLVSPRGCVQGHAALSAMVTRFVDDPSWIRVRVVALDICERSFRLRALVDQRDGTSQEVFDAGEVDGSGKISLILTFNGPLVERAGVTVQR